MVSSLKRILTNKRFFVKFWKKGQLSNQALQNVVKLLKHGLQGVSKVFASSDCFSRNDSI
jgi:hypothetical protein